MSELKNIIYREAPADSTGEEGTYEFYNGIGIEIYIFYSCSFCDRHGNALLF